MFLLELPIWSYVVMGGSLFAAVSAVLYWAHRAIHNRQLNYRRARAAASLLRVLNDEHIKHAIGVRSR